MTQAIVIAAGGGVLLILIFYGSWRLIRLVRSFRNTEQHVLSVISHLTDGVVEYTADLKIHLMNPEAEQTLGLKRWEISDRSLADFPESEKFRALKAIFAKELSGEVDFKKKERRQEEILLPFLPEKRIEVTTIPIVNNFQGQSGHNLKILHDVTRERLLDRMKSEFVSVAAHQLRTPLTGIKWALSSLREEEERMSGEQRKILFDALLAADRLVELINDLLSVARIEEGRFGFDPQPLSIAFLLEKEYERFKTVAAGKQIEFAVEITKNLPLAKFDEEKLAIVVDNLIENAIKYTEPGGKITLRAGNKNNWIEVSVEDTGIGIPRNQKERMFTKFFRSKNAQLSQTSGTGLGLYVSKNIVEQHGGVLWFESEERKGSKFFFSLPVLPEKPVAV